jgi:predicted DNA-binding helix-hairpin-helix protein
MVSIISKPGTVEKLEILSADAQYDLACACGSTKDEHRTRGTDGRWIYPITLQSGGTASLFRTLFSNVCANDCKYCPLRAQMDVRRCTLTPEETANIFLDYYNAGKVFGMFLTSGVIGSADATMERLNATAAILRKRHKFRGYIHLKVIPGASDAAVEQALSLASAVSLNIETPGADFFTTLSNTKSYERDIISPLKLISRLTDKGARYERVKHTTQFIVGAAGETDKDIIHYTAALYERLKTDRVYFSSYQKGLGDPSLPGEQRAVSANGDIFIREHRLYQIDFLFRRYGFEEKDIIFDPNGNLSLSADPKELWAQSHPEFFPVNVNSALKYELLRVPGLGPNSVNKILKARKDVGFIDGFVKLQSICTRLRPVSTQYLRFS